MTRTRIIAIVQARMKSSRLPGKVLCEIAGKPMIQHVMERVQQARLVDEVVVATTTDPSDDLLSALCHGLGVPCYRGSLYDVLDRFYQCASMFSANIVVRITGDCPLIDPSLIDLTIEVLLGLEKNLPGRASKYLLPNVGPYAYDFTANRLPPPWKRTYPIGLDVEVCAMEALERAWREAVQPYQREHVMPYLYDDIGVDFQQPSRFRVFQLDYTSDYGFHRWTVDTVEDLQFIREVFNRLVGQTPFSWLDVLSLIQHEPELFQINQGIYHKHIKETDARSDDSR